MLRLVVFLVPLVLAKAQDILGVNYTFDKDFYIYFDNRRCGNVNMWQLLNYEVLDVAPPYANSEKGIRADGDSCTSSFPIIFISGTLEIDVYVQVISRSSRLTIEVLNDYDMSSISRFDYAPFNEGFHPGWQTLSLRINKHAKGFVQLRGKTLKNELLLIDSFRYKPNTISYDRAKRSIDINDEDTTEIMFNNIYANEGENKNESSGDDEEEFDTQQPPEPTDAPVINQPEEKNSIWNPFTITILSFGVVVVVAVICVSSYHCGKVRAMENALPIDDVEPPRTITIPRATGNFNNPTRLYDL